jgi:hypothetical protein
MQENAMYFDEVQRCDHLLEEKKYFVGIIFILVSSLFSRLMIFLGL